MDLESLLVNSGSWIEKDRADEERGIGETVGDKMEGNSQE